MIRSCLPVMLFALLNSILLPSSAKVSLDSIFRDHMVLQRDAPILFWGVATNGEKITVQFAGISKQVTADHNHWEISFPAIPAGGPYTLSVSGTNKITKSDILMGDVWICAGQSNMRFRVNQTVDADLMRKQIPDPAIRLSDWEGRLNPINQAYPLSFLKELSPENFYSNKEWYRADSVHTNTFSAVGYFFGQYLQQVTGVPVGLINNSIGGVPLETYLPEETMQMDPVLNVLTGKQWLTDPVYPKWTAERVMQNLVEWEKAKDGSAMPGHPYQPGYLFKAAIAPLRKLAIKGVLWYQGESNATYTADSTAMEPALNKRKLVMLIEIWREALHAKDLPFVIIQLPSIRRDWELYREVQMQVAQEIPHVSLVVTTDLGHSTDVHPRNKKPVGERAARAAMADVYGLRVESSPLLNSFRKEGNGFFLDFSNCPNGLTTRDGEPVRRMMICGADRVFVPAKVQFAGKSIKVYADGIADPVSVRYAFEDNPFDANLVNSAGMPVSPFRTDKW